MPAPQHYPVRLTEAQRKVVADIVPDLAERLKLDEPDQRSIEFTVAELKIIQKQAAAGVRHASTGMKRNSLRRVADLIRSAWKAHGPARPKSWEAPQATRNTWRQCLTLNMSATTSSSAGVARSIQKPSTR